MSTPRHRAGKKRRYTPDQHEAILREFVRLCDIEGLRRNAALTKLGISRATLYRWSQKSDKKEHKYLGYGKEFIDIKSLISVLSEASSFEVSFLIDCIIDFIAWLRWPRQPHFYAEATIPFKLATVRHKGVKHLGELSDAELRWICQSIPVMHLVRYFSLHDTDVFTFSADVFEVDIANRKLISDIVRFLISFTSTYKEKRRQQSLSKAFKLIEFGFIDHIYHISERTAAKLWREFSPAAPFYFAETITGLNFLLDPEDVNFNTQLTRLASRSADLENFVRVALSVVRKLQSTLDPRALNNINFPVFPGSLQPKEIGIITPIAGITDDIIESIMNEKYI